jgi:hypothetical protein
MIPVGKPQSRIGIFRDSLGIGRHFLRIVRLGEVRSIHKALWGFVAVKTTRREKQ